MDDFLFNSWQNSAPPFDDHVLCLRDASLVAEPQSIEAIDKDALSLEQLRIILNIAVDRLQKACGESPLVVLDDWHEHDGIVFPGREMSWQELQRALVSNEALFDSRPGDWMVFRAFYPPGGAFLLRYFIEDEDRPIWGYFDLAGPLALLKEILAACPDDLRAKLRIKNAKQYFDDRYAG